MLLGGADVDGSLEYSHHKADLVPSISEFSPSLTTTRDHPPVLTTSFLPAYSPALCHSLKRDRPIDDNSGGEGELLPRKKRRLRLELITSRLSRPYAVPATFLPKRRTLRAGVWARQRLLRRDLLRKAAILNSIEMRRSSSGIREKDYRRVARAPSHMT